MRLFTKLLFTVGCGLLLQTGAMAQYQAGMQERLRVELHRNDGGGFKPVDGFMMRFNWQYLTPLDPADAVKFSNPGETVASVREDTWLAVEYRDVLNDYDTIPVSLTNVTIRDYQWKFTPDNFDAPGRKVFLLDAFTHDEFELSATTSSTYTFSVTSATGSDASDRFMLVTRPEAILPVTFTSIAAKRMNDGTVKVDWRTEAETSISGYRVERSANGIEFHHPQYMGMITPQNNTGAGASYSTTDIKAPSSVLYYRVTGVNMNGTLNKSAIVRVDEVSGAGIVVYPNPVQNKQMNIRFAGLPKGIYDLNIVSPTGSLIYKGSVSLTGQTETKTIPVPSSVAAGTYMLRIAGQKVIPVIIE